MMIATQEGHLESFGNLVRSPERLNIWLAGWLGP